MSCFIGVLLSEEEYERCLIKEISCIFENQNVRFTSYQAYKKFFAYKKAPEFVDVLLAVYFSYNGLCFLNKVDNIDKLFVHNFSYNQLKLVNNYKGFKGIMTALTTEGMTSDLSGLSELNEILYYLKEENLINSEHQPLLYCV